MDGCIYIKVVERQNYSTCDKMYIKNETTSEQEYTYTGCDGFSYTKSLGPGEEAFECVQTGSSVTGTVFSEVRGFCPDTTSVNPDDVYLDLPEGFNLRQTRILTELTEFNQLKFDFTVGFDLPNTRKNYDALKVYANPNVLDNEFQEVKVEVGTGSHIITQSELYVKRYGETITVELRLAVDHWARGAKDLYLHQLTYGNFTVTPANVLDVIQNQEIYDNTNTNFEDPAHLGIYFPYSNFDRIINDWTATSPDKSYYLPIELCRPWHYITGLLTRGFCQLGWAFESPLFESEIGRKLIAYIVDKEYGLKGETYLTRKTNLNVQATIAVQTTGALNTVNRVLVPFPNVVTNPIGNFSPTGVYQGSGEINVKGVVKFNPGGGAESMSFTLGKLKEGASLGDPSPYEKVYAHQVYDNFIEGQANELEFNFDVKSISMTSEERLAVVCGSSTSLAAIFLVDSEINIEGVRPYFLEGTDESMSGIIDKNYKFLDLLKGLSHQWNLKIKTDFANRTVELYQPYTVDLWGENVDGFYLEQTIEDINHLLDVESDVVTTPETTHPRYLKLMYADSKEKSIEDLELADDLWSKTIDLGEKFTTGETRELKNPFFEPLFNNGYYNYSVPILHIPEVTNTGEFTWNVGPKIAINFGYVRQIFSSSEEPTLRIGKYANSTTNLIPTASMFCPLELGTIHDDNTSAVAIPEANLVFQVNPEVYQYDVLKSLYVLVYKRWFLEQLNNLTIQYLVDLTNMEYLKTDFRNYYTFQHMGRPVSARISEILDFHFCRQIMTPVKFIPQRQLSDICDLLPEDTGINLPPTSLCQNNPTIICQRFNNIDTTCTQLTYNGVLTVGLMFIELDDGTNIGDPAGYDGTQALAAANDLKTYALGEGYIVGSTSGGANGAGWIDFITLSNTNIPENRYQVRWTSTSGGNPINGVATGCVTTGCEGFLFTIGGTNNSPIASVLFEYKLISGGGWITLTNLTTISAELCDITEDFLIRATITYAAVDGVTCDPIMTPEKLVEPCPDYDLEIECVDLLKYVSSQPVAGVRPKLVIPGQITNWEVDEYRVDGSSKSYLVDGNTVYGNTIQAGNVSYLFEFDIKIENCPITTVSKTCIVATTPIVPDCNQIDARVTCQPGPVNGSGWWIFNKVGYLPFDNDNYIKYRIRLTTSPDTFGPWLVWDETSEIQGDYIEARWFVHFCDDACPFVCSTVKICDIG